MPEEEIDFGQDMAATYAALQSDSGGTGEGSAPSSPPSPSESASPDSTSPSGAGAPAPAAPQTVVPVEPWMEFPKSWKKDYQPYWEQISPEARKVIHEREKQAFEGISKYKGVADKWSETLAPYEQVFKHYNVDAHSAFQQLANAHLTLLYGTPEQKRALAAQLNQDYGLSELLGGQPAQAEIDPAIAAPLQALQSQVGQLASTVQGYEAAQRKAVEAQSLKETEAFFADPTNEFAGEVITDMMSLIRAGAATDLKSAYDMAIWTNPAVRATLLGREAEKLAKSKVPDTPTIRSSATPAAPTSNPDESIEDTLKTVFHQIQQRH